MRQRKLRQVMRTILSYGLSALVVISVPISAVYAEDTQAPAVQTQQETPTQVTENADTQTATSVPAPAPAVSKSRENLSQWRADKKAKKAAEQQAAASSTTPTATAKSGESTVAAVQPDGTVSDVAGKVSAQSTVNAATSTAIANALDSLAQSGNADVIKNTTAGNATTGNATATATVINNVNSIVANQNNKEVASFVTDVMGDTNGDIILQPMLLKAMLEANTIQPTNSTVKSTNTTAIQNDLTLAATSGNAAVIANTQAGNATTGSANTVADVVNIVNSMVSANQSFIGTINIYGNLNGDILIAPDFIPQMIANNKNVQVVNPESTIDIEASNTDSIVNNVTLAAESGQAFVDENTQAGHATSGNANTNLVVFNLTGHDVVASNSLLVFINVLGNWVGVIVDAPTGATAAAIGSGVTSASSSAQPSMAIDINNATQLVNNIDLSSKSGDATVARNTVAGNATTGNATASANILNMSNSQLSLGGWFGVLFINVFGTWNGSFGIDTAAGTIVTVPSSGKANNPPAVIRFAPRGSSDTSTQQANAASYLTTVSSTGPSEVTVANTVMASGYQPQPVADFDDESQVLGQAATKGRSVNMALVIGSVVVIGISLFGIRRLLA